MKRGRVGLTGMLCHSDKARLALSYGTCKQSQYFGTSKVYVVFPIEPALNDNQ